MLIHESLFHHVRDVTQTVRVAVVFGMVERVTAEKDNGRESFSPTRHNMINHGNEINLFQINCS